MSGYGMDLPKSTNVNTNYTPAKAGKAGKAAEANTVKQPLLSFETKELGRDLLGVAGKTDVNADLAIRQNKEIAADTTAILKDLGFNYQVTPAQVGRVGNIMTAEAAPAMDLATVNADLSRTNPDKKSLETRMGFMMEDAFSQLDALMA